MARSSGAIFLLTVGKELVYAISKKDIDANPELATQNILTAIVQWGGRHPVSAPRKILFAFDGEKIFEGILQSNKTVLKDMVEAYGKYGNNIVPITCQEMKNHEEVFGILWTTPKKIENGLPKIAPSGKKTVALYVPETPKAICTYRINCGEEFFSQLQQCVNI